MSLAINSLKDEDFGSGNYASAYKSEKADTVVICRLKE